MWRSMLKYARYLSKWEETTLDLIEELMGVPETDDKYVFFAQMIRKAKDAGIITISEAWRLRDSLGRLELS